MKKRESLQEQVLEAKDEEKYAEAVDMPGQKVDTKTRMTVRNLRIREDTAKIFTQFGYRFCLL